LPKAFDNAYKESMATEQGDRSVLMERDNRGNINTGDNIHKAEANVSVSITQTPPIESKSSRQMLQVGWESIDLLLVRNYLQQCAKYDSLYKGCKHWDDRQVRERLVNDGLAFSDQEETFLTDDGVLFSCKRGQIPAAIFHVDIKFINGDFREELYGSVLWLYKELRRRLKLLFERRLGSPDIRDEEGGEKVFYEYPEIAIHEALVNLLIHRDYSQDDIASIIICSDKIIFENPGKSAFRPEELMNAEDALKPRYDRNQRLIQAMSRARLNQREGNGIVRIKESLRENGSFLPSGEIGLNINYDENKNRFSLTIFKRSNILQARVTHSASGALHQLPPPPADFTGRETEIAELLSTLEDASLPLSGLQGIGGVGKTALALKLAEKIKERYPDGQFYLDLLGFGLRPLTPAEAMTHVIHSYHPGARLPESEAELRGIYLSVLHNQRALLLMDNARDGKQIEPLIPPAGCKLIVTSRQHFALPGLFAKSLDCLPPEDACKLLLTIAPRIGELAGEIARLCGYLPVALRLAAHVIAERRNIKPADYMRQLADAQKRLELIEASLSLSYDILSEEQQQWWRMLAVFPDSFDESAAAAVWEAEGGKARDTLSELLAFSLVEWNEATGRYRLHNLLRVFVDSRISKAERDGSRRLHAQHYQIVLSAANNLYLKGGDGVLRGLALFDLERVNIEAGHASAAEQVGSDEAAAELCIAYPDAGGQVLGLRQHPHERIQWLEAMLTAAGRLNRRDAEGTALGNLGTAYADLGETRRAIEFYQQHLQIARETGDRKGEGRALGYLGTAYADLGETRRAIEFYEQRLVIARETDDRRGEGSALGNLGTAYADLGETRRAIEFYEQDLQIARETGDRRSEGQTLGNLGLAYAALGETRRAIEFFEQYLVIARETGDRRSEGNALGNLGIAYADLGETRRAIEFFGQDLAIARETGDRRGEGNALWNTALALYWLEDQAQATIFAEAALGILEQIEDPRAQEIRRMLYQARTGDNAQADVIITGDDNIVIGDKKP
jgi:tetratricopeptide (TPR) repeat protein